jgi:hypothetical protein
MSCEKLAYLTYTTDDDGVWLQCLSCGFKKNLGFDGTAKDVLAAEVEHSRGERT